MSRRRMSMFCATLVVAFALTATSALAGDDTFFSGTLMAGFGVAGVAAHSVTYIEGTANANGFCVAKDQGLTGTDFATRAVAGTRACATSGGFAARTENGACCYHGWIDNDLGSEIIVNSSTHTSF
jgi:hypothetical protein